MLGFSGFPRQLIVPAAVRLATLIANRGDKAIKDRASFRSGHAI
jgi:hypothetical protein